MIGNTSFLKQFTESKISKWIDQLSTLSDIVETQPHTAYSAFTQLAEPLATELLQPLESAITSQFIPSLIGISPPGTLMRSLLALPCKLGGLNIANPVNMASEQYSSSIVISDPLVDLIHKQDQRMLHCNIAQHVKSTTKAFRLHQQKATAKNIYLHPCKDVLILHKKRRFILVVHTAH